jgi:CPA1 family monovalent cation:H+ antiporter
VTGPAFPLLTSWSSSAGGGVVTGPALLAGADGATGLAIELLFALLLAATFLAVVARKLGIPYPILLVLGGLAIGFIPNLPTFELAPDLVFLLFLPPILFAAGYFTSIRELKAFRRPILLLAIGLVTFTTFVVGGVTKALVPEMPWAAAFALGAIVAPPDAAAATTIFQRLGVPRRTVTILEGESLLNDATALVLYRLAILAAGGTAVSIVDAGQTFVVAAFGGIAIGIVVGWLTTKAVSRVDDPVFSIVVTFLAPLAAYLPAAQFELSGVLASVVAGIYVGRDAPRLMSSAVRVSGVAAWQILLFLINGTVFILLGLQLPQILEGLGEFSPGRLIGLAVAVALTTILTRLVWVYPAAYLPRRFNAGIREHEPRPTERNVFIVGWAGMRGVVSLAAALALPIDFPERNLVIFLTFAVILATLVGQGLTLPLIIRALGIDDGGNTGQEEAYARYVASEAAIARLEELAVQWPGHLELIDRLKAQYEDRTRHAVVAKHPEQRDEAAEQELIEHRQIRMAVLGAEREALLTLRERGAIADEVHRIVERDLDLEELRMEV